MKGPTPAGPGPDLEPLYAAIDMRARVEAFAEALRAQGFIVSVNENGSLVVDFPVAIRPTKK